MRRCHQIWRRFGTNLPVCATRVGAHSTQNDALAAARVFAAPRKRLVMLGVNVTAGTIVDEQAMQALHRADTEWGPT